jgi:hypothetical protein
MSYRKLARALRPRRTSAGLVAAGVIAGSTLVMPSAGAAPPREPSDCPAGYSLTVAYKTYGPAGLGTIGRNATTSVPLFNEVTGLGCFRRSGNTGFMRLRWNAIGRLGPSVLHYMIYDCTLGSVAHRWTEGYTVSSPGTSGVFPEGRLALIPTHKYAGQISGSGTYSRDSTRLPSEGFIGHFVVGTGAVTPPGPVNPFTGNVPRWFGRTACF